MVTCGTYHKAHLLNTAQKLGAFNSLLFRCVEEAGWELHAWAILSNHYHFIASSPSDPSTLRRMISKIHTLSARDFNLKDKSPGRRVWFQYFDSHITFPTSYFARLKYVHHNPSHHDVVANAENYRWCSAAWFTRTASPAFRATVAQFKTDKLSVRDAFVPLTKKLDDEESGVKPPHSK